MENTKQRVILVVDDDPHLRQILTEKFSSQGFLVESAKNGDEALSLIEILHPDLILLDILMPKKDGIQTLKELRTSSHYGANVPVIVLTNVSEKDLLASALEIGIDDYLIKAEIKLSDLVKKVNAILGLQD